MTSRCCGRKAAFPNTRRLAKSSSDRLRSSGPAGAKGSATAGRVACSAAAASGGGSPATDIRKPGNDFQISESDLLLEAAKW